LCKHFLALSGSRPDSFITPSWLRTTIVSVLTTAYCASVRDHVTEHIDRARTSTYLNEKIEETEIPLLSRNDVFIDNSHANRRYAVRCDGEGRAVADRRKGGALRPLGQAASVVVHLVLVVLAVVKVNGVILVFLVSHRVRGAVYDKEVTRRVQREACKTGANGGLGKSFGEE
jgi:hypothetical protein